MGADVIAVVELEPKPPNPLEGVVVPNPLDGPLVTKPEEGALLPNPLEPNKLLPVVVGAGTLELEPKAPVVPEPNPVEGRKGEAPKVFELVADVVGAPKPPKVEDCGAAGADIFDVEPKPPAPKPPVEEPKPVELEAPNPPVPIDPEVPNPLVPVLPNPPVDVVENG